MTETPSTVHGRLLEAFHLSGYSYERACSELEWLLDDDRWQLAGNGFDDIHAFMATIDFSEFKVAVEQRKKIAQRLSDIDASQRAIAKMLGVNQSTISRALGNGHANASPNEEKTKQKQKQNQKPDAVASAPFQGKVKDVVKAVQRKAAQADKGARRAEREQALGTRIQAEAARLPGMGPFGVILADPSWRFEPWSRETGMDRAADNHYPTASTDELCKLTPPAADAAVLFLWAVVPMLPDALRLMAAWGFTYKSAAVWVKDRIGTGYWFRNEMELLLVGTRGNIPAPAPGTQPSQIMDDPASEHSVKPTTAHEFIDRLFPNLPKLEMFARSGRPGWDAWGAEAPLEIAEAEQ